MPAKHFRLHNHFHTDYVSSTDFVLFTDWNFNSIGIALMIQSNDITDVMQYSFDGEHVHGDMTPTMPSEAIIFDNRVESKIWFRRAEPGAPVLVRVEAWKNDA